MIIKSVWSTPELTVLDSGLEAKIQNPMEFTSGGGVEMGDDGDEGLDGPS